MLTASPPFRRDRLRHQRIFCILLAFFLVSFFTCVGWYESNIPEIKPTPATAGSVPPDLDRKILSAPTSDKKTSSPTPTASSSVRTDLYIDSYTENTEEFISETTSLMKRILTEELFNMAFSTRRHFASVNKFNSTASLVAFKHNSEGNGTQRLKVMIVCGMHARELFSSDMCRSWLLYTALAVRSKEARFSAAPIDWLYVPVANPSGRDLVTDSYASRDGSFPWTKCHRGNWRGVDLNRNWRMYDEDLYEGYGSKMRRSREPHRLENRVPLPEENPGQESFSEAETVILRDLLDDFNPDLMLSVHTGTTSLSYPNEDIIDEPPTYLGLMRVAGRMVDWSGCRNFKPRCIAGQSSRILYVSKGTMVDYAYRLRRCALPFTLESYGGPPPVDERTWDDDPDACFYHFNPPQSQLVNYLKRWKPLWHGLYYMNPRDQVLIKNLVRQFEEELEDDGQYKHPILPELARSYRGSALQEDRRAD